MTQVGNNSLKISWNKMPNVKGYVLYCSTKPDSGFSSLKWIPSDSLTEYVHTNRALDVVYYYKVKSYDVVGKSYVYSQFSETASGFAHVDPPSKAEGTAIYDIAYNKLKITWDAVPGASGYAVYVSDAENGKFSLVRKINGSSVVEYIHSGRVLDRVYYYKVVPYISVGSKMFYSTDFDIVPGVTHVDPPEPVEKIETSCYSYNQICISWDAVDDAYGYTIYTSTSADGKYSVLKNITGSGKTQFIHSSRSLGKEYFYKVASYKAAGYKKIYAEPSEISSASTYLKAPSTPVLTANSNGTVTVRFTKVAGAQKYNLYRSEDGGEYTPVKTLFGTSYVDSNTVPTKLYSYKLYAIRGSFSSDISPSASVTASIDAPIMTSASSAAPDAVLLKWKSVSGASRYNIYCSTTPDGDFCLADTTNKLQFKVTGLDTDTTYYFRVTSLKTVKDIAGESDFSSYLSVTPKISPVSIRSVTNIGRESIFVECVLDKSVDGYLFYRSETANGEFELIGKTDKYYFADNTAELDHYYYYKVSAFKTVKGNMHVSALSSAKGICKKVNVSNDKIDCASSKRERYEYLNTKFSSLDTHFIGDTSRKVIYLNFSYGTLTDNAPKVLDTLKEKDVKAGFFTLLSTVNKRQEIIQRIIDEGHILGNHTVGNISLYGISDSKLAYQVDTMTNYVKSNYDYDMQYFSYPRGEFSLKGVDYVYSKGYTSIFYSYTYKDYGNTPVSKAYAYRNLTNNLHPGAIYLLHLECDANAKVLGDFIDYARSQGYEVESLETLRNR